MSITGKFREWNSDANDVFDVVQSLRGGKVDTPAVSSAKLAWAHGVERAGGKLLPPVQGRKGQHYHQGHCQPKKHLKETQKQVVTQAQSYTYFMSICFHREYFPKDVENGFRKHMYIQRLSKKPVKCT